MSDIKKTLHKVPPFNGNAAKKNRTGNMKKKSKGAKNFDRKGRDETKRFASDPIAVLASSCMGKITFWLIESKQYL